MSLLSGWRRAADESATAGSFVIASGECGGYGILAMVFFAGQLRDFGA
jgi:hypothetical protein